MRTSVSFWNHIFFPTCRPCCRFCGLTARNDQLKSPPVMLVSHAVLFPRLSTIYRQGLKTPLLFTTKTSMHSISHSAILFKITVLLLNFSFTYCCLAPGYVTFVQAMRVRHGSYAGLGRFVHQDSQWVCNAEHSIVSNFWLDEQPSVNFIPPSHPELTTSLRLDLMLMARVGGLVPCRQELPFPAVTVICDIRQYA